MSFIKKAIETFRTELLDLTKRNNLISYKHSARSVKQLRIVEECISNIYEKILSGEELRIDFLPPQDNTPKDERTEEFKRKHEKLKLTDEEYITKKANLGKEPSERAFLNLDNWLKDKTRVELGLGPIDRAQLKTAEEHAKKLGINPSYDLALTSRDKKHSDNKLQTLFYEDQIERRLKAVHEQCRLYENEAGISILYISLGFLHWYETETSEEVITSPLVLLPIGLKKELKKGKYEYTVFGRDEDPSHNLCLEEKLRKDFGIIIPKFDEEASIAKYFKKIEILIKDKKNWSVKNQATIGFFSFSKIAMFRDLAPENWDAKVTDEESLIFSLINGKESPSDTFAEDYDIDILDRTGEAPHTISDADSSQMSAIIDVLRGTDLVIEGPPGTGKSQTITNIIAASIEAGKKVLFIAEKKAALDVVKNRLDKAGLGAFCLELHSNKSKRADVAKSFGDVKQLRSKRKTNTDISSEIASIKATKGKIKQYLNAIHDEYGPLRTTYQELIWDYLKASTKITHLEGIDTVIIDDIPKIDKSKRETLTSELKKLNLYALECRFDVTNPTSYPWYPFYEKLTLDNHIYIELDLKKLKAALGSAREAISKSPACPEINDHLSISNLMGLFNALSKSSIQDITHEKLNELKDPHKRELFFRYDQLKKEEITTQQKLKVFSGDRTIEVIQSSIHEWQKFENTSILHGSLTLQKCEMRLEEIRKLTNELLFSIQKIKETCTAASLASPSSKMELEFLLRIYATFKTTPKTFFSRLCPAIWSAEASEIQSELKKQRDECRITYESLKMAVLNEAFEIEYDQIREHSKNLGEAGIFSIFKKRFRDSKKKTKKLFIDPNATDSFKSIILSDINKYRNTVSDINSNPRFLSICRGAIPTQVDISNIEECILFAAKIKGVILSSVGIFAERAATVIQSNDSSQLERVMHLLLSPDLITSIEKVVSELSKTQKLSTDELMSSLENESAALSACSNLLSSISSRKDLELSQLQFLVANFEDLKSIRASLNEVRPHLSDMLLSLNVEQAKVCISLIESFQNTSVDKELLQRIYKLQTEPLRELLNYILLQEPSVSYAYEVLNHFFSKWYNDSESILQSLYRVPLGRLNTTYDNLIFNIPLLKPYIQFKEAQSYLSENGLGLLLSHFYKFKLPLESLNSAFDYLLPKTIVDTFLQINPELRRNMGISLSELRSLFKTQDNKLIELKKLKLKEQLLKSPIEEGVSRGRVSEYIEMGFIDHQINLSTRHAPVRDYFIKAPISSLSLKPCLMMSPLSISQYLPSDSIQFDLVVMDEASQLKPADALGAILRARQVVVVGDPKQLPPTSFFDFTTDDAASDDEDVNELASYESILDIALKSFRPARRLKWHYRSRHESLITISNKSFYDDDLIIFPSPHFDNDEFGLHYRYLDDAVYQGSKNVKEAQEIIKYVAQHAVSFPGLSIGIVTMNKPQQDLLNDLYDAELRSNPDLQVFHDRHESSLESVIIKNLENIQGDERDVILISTVYGKEPGANSFKQRFGPINGKMGHRRLNVLFTRSRFKTIVFSSLDPDKIVTEQNSSIGLKAFKSFLLYARSKKTQEIESLGEPDSDFEIYVMSALRESGFEVHSQVGVSGYRIDLAVVHPKLPGKYLLGIECDGATYHSSKYARDRDKIRQDILESLGWKIYRIWSTDWFNDSKRETQKLIDEIKKVA